MFVYRRVASNFLEIIRYTWTFQFEGHFFSVLKGDKSSPSLTVKKDGHTLEGAAMNTRLTSWWQLKYFLFSSRKLGKMVSHFDEHIFSKGLVKNPPTSLCIYIYVFFNRGKHTIFQ